MLAGTARDMRELLMREAKAQASSGAIEERSPPPPPANEKRTATGEELAGRLTRSWWHANATVAAANEKLVAAFGGLTERSSGNGGGCREAGLAGGCVERPGLIK